MTTYAFGPFLLDTADRRLLRAGERVALSGKAFEMLHALAEAGGRLVEREALYARLWPDTIVEERTLTVHASTLRRLLNAGGPVDYLETVPRVGYRLTVPAALVALDEARAPTADRSGSKLIALAVLPLSTASLGEADRFLGLGIADAIIIQLGGLPGLSVRPTSAIKDLVDGGSATTIARQLNVDHVLEGVVQRSGDRLRVSVQLVVAADGAIRWGARFEEAATDTFALQDAIATRVAGSLVPRLTVSDETRLRAYQPRAPEAHLLQIRARVALSARQRDEAFEALELFQRAIALDGDYALAHAGLASTYLLLTSTLIGRPLRIADGARLARGSAERALALDPRLGEAHAVLAQLRFFYDWDWRGAEEHFRQAVEASPSASDVAEQHGWFLAAMGRHAEALEELERAHRLDPLGREALERLGLVQWLAGAAEEGLATLARAAALDPTARRPHLRRMFIFDQLGRHREAMEERAQWLVLFGKPDLAERLKALHRADGYRAAMIPWLRLFDELGQSYEVAVGWMAIGEPERALEALERALDERAAGAPLVPQFPSFRPLRGNPRYDRLLERLGLDDAGPRGTPGAVPPYGSATVIALPRTAAGRRGRLAGRRPLARDV